MGELRGLLGELIPVPATLSDDELGLLAALEAVLADTVAPEAVANDARGRYPRPMLDALARTGLMRASVPQALGGPGFSQRFSLEAQLRIARVDSAVAQLFKVHDELVREIPCYTDASQQTRFARLVLEDGAIVGLAVAEAGRTAEEPLTTTSAQQADGSYLVDGRKIYTTGAARADVIATWTYDAAQATPDAPLKGMQLFLIPRDTPGVVIHEDWDALGQRATDSGTVTFDKVCCAPEWRSSVPGEAPLVQASLRYQAGFAAVLTGIGVGALEAAAPFVREHSRPWAAAGVAAAAADPLLQLRAGEYAAGLVAAYHATMATAALFDAFDEGHISRGALALPVSAAKVTAHHAALAATSGLHGLMGTRSVASAHGFDRFWRNARTLSLHDPVDHKARELGRHLFTGAHPEPGVYQ